MILSNLNLNRAIFDSICTHLPALAGSWTRASEIIEIPKILIDQDVGTSLPQKFLNGGLNILKILIFCGI